MWFSDLNYRPKIFCVEETVLAIYVSPKSQYLKLIVTKLFWIFITHENSLFINLNKNTKNAMYQCKNSKKYNFGLNVEQKKNDQF